VDDLVKTRDHGFQPIRWIGGKTMPAVGKLAPIVFTKGAIGNDVELAVSPEHRMLIEGYRVEILFGQDQVLVSAKFLCDGDMIYRKAGGTVTYFHFMFDQHEIVYSNGVPTESFLPENNAMSGLEYSAQQEIFEIFPELEFNGHSYIAANMCLRSYEAKLLA